MKKHFEQELTSQFRADSINEFFMNIPPQQQFRLPIFEDASHRSDSSLADQI